MVQRIYGFALILVAVFGLAVASSAQSPAQQSLPAAQQSLVDKFVLSDTIQPITQSELERAIARANSDGAHALLIELDTPGGLLDSTRTMVGAILSSKVPIIVYVSPAGARAGSAGFFLLEAADIAAMDPGTNAGAAHPVIEIGPQPDSVMNQKIENDTEAFLRSYVTKRNRNAEAAEAAVHSSHSYTAQEALDQHLIDLTAPNEWELLRELDGRAITRMDGTKMTLHLANPSIVTLRPTLREELLGWLVNPNIALLFLVGGALLIYFEFNAPGTIVPGALGTLMVLLAIFALDLLPIRFTSVLLLVAALILILLEAKVGGHGALAIAGIICLTFGTLTLVAAPIPELAISPLVAFSVSAAFALITLYLVRIAMRARHQKSRLGPSALVGCRASAMESLNPEGHVLVEGEIWRAVSSQPVSAGTPLRVVGLEQYLLHVEPAHPTIPPQSTA
ncbi:MAG: nodulation protein NfeD [Terracidiphilus sp.]|jgi:membrane-bound serine protease (ClpP class)